MHQINPEGECRNDHWADMTERWSHVGRPLKPGPDDIETFERYAALANRAHADEFRALLLGVTPEIAGCRWPSGVRLAAMDFSQSMIGKIWPARGTPPNSHVICANWLAMPVEAGCLDFVIGDGCHAAVRFPDDVAAVFREVARVLRPDGMFVLRAFIRPATGEGVDDIARDFAAGRVGSVHVLKWRLFAALCHDTQSGTPLGEVWTAWDRMRSSARWCGPGWTAAEMGTIEVYRGDNETRFYFPTFAELGELASRYFRSQQVSYGNYELADRCPIIALTLPKAVS